jgi:hypothetical protein
MMEGNILSAIGPENVGELNMTIIGTEVEIEIANTIAAENTIETAITMGTEIEIATKFNDSSESYHRIGTWPLQAILR